MASKKKKTNVALKEMAKAARVARMSYGCYAAKMFQEEQAEQRRKKRAEEEATKQERRIENIQTACEENGLSGHITWISKDTMPMPGAAEIAWITTGSKSFPAKTSCMFCDELDMCFFYTKDGTACVSFSGTAAAGSEDIEHNIMMAFRTAKKVLDRMQELEKGE